MGHYGREYELGPAEIMTDIIIPSIPIAGFVVGVTFGMIDLGYEFSKEQGAMRITSAVVSHLIYAILFLVH